MKNRKNIVIVVMFVLVFAVGFFAGMEYKEYQIRHAIGDVVNGVSQALGGFSNEKKVQSPVSTDDQKLETVVKQIVSSYLKSPGSAQFVDLIVRKNITVENQYVAFGDVDSQNGFGALLRSHFFLKIIDNGGNEQNIDNWTVDQLDLGDFSLIFDEKLQDTPIPILGETLTARKKLEDIIRGSI